MTLSPRAKAALIVIGFALPVVASFLVYTFGDPKPTANYGTLLLPPETVTRASFRQAGADDFAFTDLRGRWVLVTADAGGCGDACQSKLVAMRQIRLALGRDAERVALVTVVDDGATPSPQLRDAFPGMVFALPAAPLEPTGPTADRAHIYLVDPHGNVMMRWPAQPDYRRLKGDLDRLLRASQIG